MKKYFLVLMLAIMCIFVLAVSASATEYTIESNSEYQEAFENAVNGDTIVINSALTCDIQATKSITYVLNADWQNPKMIIASNVEVSFIADGGDYKIMPTAYSTETGWLNIADEYENVVINLGGMNGGTLTIDGSNATHDRVSYVTATAPEITLNLLDGSAIANFNPETRDSDQKAFIIYARNINMYSGSKIYANRIGGAPLLRATYFNLFGGEIFGNLLESKRTISNTSAGAIFVYEGIMVYGGRIYENIFNAKNTIQNNQIGFFTTMGGKNTVVLDLEIGDTYVTGNGQTEISAMFGTLGNGSKFYYNSGMKKGTRYQFTGTPELKYDETTGKTIWKVSKSTQLSTDWTGKSWVHGDGYEGSVVAAFIKAEKKSIAGNNFDSYTVIDARIEGKYPYSVSVIAMPSEYDLWSTDGNKYCHTGKAYTLEEVKASSSAVFYSAYNAERITIDGIASCPDCGMVYTCNNPEHDLQIVSISYSKYTELGKTVLKCNTCNLEKASEGIAEPLFECLGYSSPQDGSGGIVIGFKVNNEAIAEYISVTEKTLKYGVFAVAQKRLGDGDVFNESGEIKDGTICADITSYGFVSFELKIVGFTTETHKNAKLAMGAYVAVTDGETTEYSYMQSGTPNDGEKYCFVSYNDIVPTTSSEDDEVAQ